MNFSANFFKERTKNEDEKNLKTKN